MHFRIVLQRLVDQLADVAFDGAAIVAVASFQHALQAPRQVVEHALLARSHHLLQKTPREVVTGADLLLQTAEQAHHHPVGKLFDQQVVITAEQPIDGPPAHVDQAQTLQANEQAANPQYPQPAEPHQRNAAEHVIPVSERVVVPARITALEQRDRPAEQHVEKEDRDEGRSMYWKLTWMLC